ncbi:protein FAM47E isoform X6 [Manis pentadactyla]|uniref:protein FAM47E isoform X6 n=1 Tax=Manis pentadactyla TaxID=143292 RepID=UPI00255C7178|nr:protein FAM47E isoform X6 [Manis pentadactyla]
MADNRRQFRPGAPSRAPGSLSCRPGHKEDLPSKGFTKPTPRLALPTSLDGQMRVFVRKGLDDFGSGSLPQVCHGAPQPAPKKRQNKLPMEVALPAKLLAARQARRAFLEDVEAQLAPHPLALYPHLEEDTPVELLLKVLEVLDPDKKLEDSWAYCQGIRKRAKEPTQLLKKCSTQVSLGLSKKTPVSHPGQWLYEEKKPIETHLLHEGGPYHENVHKVVCDFCNWATTFNPCKPKYVKMRYGAWYLKTDLWKKQRVDEPLVDPKISCKAQDENCKKQLQGQELLADLHGMAAFKDFILRRGYRMPSADTTQAPARKGILSPRQELRADTVKTLKLPEDQSKALQRTEAFK